MAFFKAKSKASKDGLLKIILSFVIFFSSKSGKRKLLYFWLLKTRFCKWIAKT